MTFRPRRVEEKKTESNHLWIKDGLVYYRLTGENTIEKNIFRISFYESPTLFCPFYFISFELAEFRPIRMVKQKEEESYLLLPNVQIVSTSRG